MAADGWIAFNQYDLVSGVGDVQRRLNAADAAAEHQGGLGHRHFDRMQRLVALDLFHQHGDQIDGFVRGDVRFLVHPGTMFAQIGHLAEVRVQSRFVAHPAKRRLVHARRAGGDHDAGQLVLCDGLADKRLAGIRAHVLVIHAVGHAGNFTAGFGHSGAIHRSTDIFTAMTDKYADTRHERPLQLYGCVFRNL